MSKAEKLTTIIDEIVNERVHQINKGFTPAHDNTLVEGELAEAAAVYASTKLDPKEWYPRGWIHTQAPRRKQLIKAAALIIAEIERLDRLFR